MKKLLKGHWLKLLPAILLIVLLVLYTQRKRIAENKYTKAKLEIFKAYIEKDSTRMREVIDSL